jgi:hypothetical protein
MGQVPQWDKFEVIRDDGRKSARWYHWIGVAILGFVAGVCGAVYLGMGGGSRRRAGSGMRDYAGNATQADVAIGLVVFGIIGAVAALVGFAWVKFQSAAAEKRREQELAERKASARMYK